MVSTSTNLEKSGEKTLHNIPAPVIAFIAGSLLFALLLVINRFLLIDGGSILNGDNFDQYMAFISSFLRVLKGEQSFWYSFSLYAGSPSVLTYVYYALSPFNLLYLLPGLSLITITHLIAVLKTGLAAAAFAYYSEKTLGQKKLSAVFFSLCYAFCSWAVIMSVNCMWADSLYTLPLIIVFISKQLRKPSIKDYLCLTLCYAYLFITNFYTGYIIGFFTAFYFVCMTVCTEKEIATDLRTHIVNAIKKIGIYVSSAALAAALCAALLLPAAYFLFSHLKGASESFTGLSASLPDVFSALFACSGTGLYSATPYIYCGLPVLLLAPFYFFMKEISFSRKVATSLMLIFYFCATLFLPLYAFLHAFDNPNYYPFRFSPCMVFILVSIAERVWQHRTEIASKTLWIFATALCTAYAFLVVFSSITGNTSISDTWLILNAVFLFTWVALIVALSTGKGTKYIPYAAFFLLTAELLISSSVSLHSVAGSSSADGRRISSEDFSHWYHSEKNAAETIKSADNGFYRVRVNNEKCFNGASLFGLNTLTSFASYEDLAQRTAFADLGFGNAYHMIYDITGTSLTDMLFSVKYTIDIPSDQTDTSAIIKQNQMVLPIAYTVSSDIASYIATNDPFENMNNLTRCMTGKDINIFETVSGNDMAVDSFNTYVYNLGDMIAFDIMTDKVSKGYVTYAIPKDETKKAYVYFQPMNGTYFNSLSPYITASYPTGLNCSLTMANGALYEVNKNKESAGLDSENTSFNADDYVYLILYINTDGYTSYSVNDILFSYYDEAAVNEVYTYLNEGSMNLTSFDDDHIEGTVTATEERPVLFTSIPYDKGWSAYVDGVPTKIYVTTDDAFCALALAPGEHSIAFDYTAPYSFAGSVISTLAVIILAVIFLKRNTSVKKHNKENANEIGEKE
ncbi:MAG: YfhO family protein [Lachnospiraceae bacterium]|nr:YfhO family protein [Lachnospiraceae bacterium]